MRLEVLKGFQVVLHVCWSTFAGAAQPIDAARLRLTCAVFGKKLAGAPLRRENDEQFTILRNKHLCSLLQSLLRDPG
jgi:hypothetical protein